MKYLVLIAAFALSACATPQNKGEAVYAAKAAYIGALTVAVAYKKLPYCSEPKAPIVCARQELIEQILIADDRAFAAITTAEAVMRAGSTAEMVGVALAKASEMVDIFASITSKLRVR